MVPFIPFLEAYMQLLNAIYLDTQVLYLNLQRKKELITLKYP